MTRERRIAVVEHARAVGTCPRPIFGWCPAWAWHPGTRTRHRRRAFTLIEMLMVLALVLMVGALAWPSMDRPLATQSLRSGVDEVRTTWVRARIHAMNTGQIFAFHYAPGADHYAVDCQSTPEFAADADLYASSGGNSQDPTAQFSEDRHLPKNIRFGGGQTAADGRSQQAESTETQSAAAASDPQFAAADPIFFYPDGTASTAVVRVQNQYGRMIEMSLRGLTGVVTVSPLQDAPPGSATGNEGPSA